MANGEQNVIIAIDVGDSKAYRYSVEELRIRYCAPRGLLGAGGVEDVSRELAHGARDNLNDLRMGVSITRP